MSKYLQRALVLGLSVVFTQSVHAEPDVKPAAPESAAARKEKEIRKEVLEKQKELFERKHIALDEPKAESSATVDVPLDETDSPGATEQ
ncbi:MAG TPA: hypothetical protein VF800_31510 [Telluria sp.]|jgi:hypothetical protein